MVEASEVRVQNVEKETISSYSAVTIDNEVIFRYCTVLLVLQSGFFAMLGN